MTFEPDVRWALRLPMQQTLPPRNRMFHNRSGNFGLQASHACCHDAAVQVHMSASSVGEAPPDSDSETMLLSVSTESNQCSSQRTALIGPWWGHAVCDAVCCFRLAQRLLSVLTDTSVMLPAAIECARRPRSQTSRMHVVHILCSYTTDTSVQSDRPSRR